MNAVNGPNNDPNNDPDNDLDDETRALLAPLLALVTAIDEADLLNVELPLEMPGLLEDFLDPEVQAALPAALRPAADAYLRSLPGYRAGNIARAGGQHRLRLDVWNGEAMPISEEDIEALGLEEAPEDG